jgi:hypothetical protein
MSALCQKETFRTPYSSVLGSIYRRGRSQHWVKVKNPKAPAVVREAEEDWALKWARPIMSAAESFRRGKNHDCD